MKITLFPVGSFNDSVPPRVDGDRLIFNGDEYDFSPLQEGDSLEIGDPFIGEVIRENGEINVTLRYRYDWNTSLDHPPINLADRFTFTLSQGSFLCPIVRKPIESEQMIGGVNE